MDGRVDKTTGDRHVKPAMFLLSVTVSQPQLRVYCRNRDDESPLTLTLFLFQSKPQPFTEPAVS